MKLTTTMLATPLIICYFGALLLGFYLVDWHQFSLLAGLITFYVALFIADFVSGLVHIYIDYQPLNFAKGYGQLFHYQGDRGSENFRRMRKEIASRSSLFDMVVYQFKIHHRTASPYLAREYHSFFYETCVPATVLLIASILLSSVEGQLPLKTYLSFALLVISVSILHTNHIHVWVHGSHTMPWGVAITKVVQRLHLMYSVETHNRHHKDGESGFCFIIGHANFLVDALCRFLLRLGIIEKRHWLGIQ